MGKQATIQIVSIVALVSACGSVSGDKVDAALPNDDGMIVNGDAAWTNNALWQVTDGLPDQGCAPWTLVDTAAPEDPMIIDGHLTLATDTNAETMNYRQSSPNIVAPATTFVMEARTRFVSGMSNVNDRSALDMGFKIGGKMNVFRVIDGSMFLLADSTTRGPVHTAPTVDMFHDYRVEMHLATGAISVSRDGTSVLTGMAFATPDVDAVYFGDSSGSAYGVTEWIRVSHNAHALGPCP